MSCLSSSSIDTHRRRSRDGSRGVHPGELSHDKADLEDAQNFSRLQRKQAQEEWQLGVDQWEVECEPLRLENRTVANEALKAARESPAAIEARKAARERFAELWKSEHKRISAQAKAMHMGLVSSSEVTAVLMHPWVNNIKEWQFSHLG